MFFMSSDEEAREIREATDGGSWGNKQSIESNIEKTISICKLLVAKGILPSMWNKDGSENKYFMETFNEVRTIIERKQGVIK